MPAKYMIRTYPTPHRFEPVSRSGIIAWEEGCLKCAVCVKKQCVYGVYEKRGLKPDQMIDSIDNQCMNCLRCVQGCPMELIHKSINPEYKALGDTYWTPEIITSLWYQAETGKIPVSGAGYPGPFSGPGFDAMWTDMSEIVRPTRDGIHGREYISTAVDLGIKPACLSFNAEGGLAGDAPEVLTVQLPVLLSVPPFGDMGPETLKGWAMAARRLGTLMALEPEAVKGMRDDFHPYIVLQLPEAEKLSSGLWPQGIRMVEMLWQEGILDAVEKIRRFDSSRLVSVRVPMEKGMEERALELVRNGVSVVHLSGTVTGTYQDDETAPIRDGIRAVHLRLVEEGLRDGMTLLTSGGVAMAEHVAKSLICGADAVFVDLPLLVALECRVCRRCTQGLSCPVELHEAPALWVARRVINLMGAWHNQLLEVMGAMGMRDARRLRGEAGRAMFFEELDRATFQDLGRPKEGYRLE